MGLTMFDEISLSATPDEHVFHFTDSARLPWILETGELRPHDDGIGAFLWATTQEYGDYTAHGFESYFKRMGALVRMTLHASDFKPWDTIRAGLPKKVMPRVEKMEKHVHRHWDIEGWRLRPDPLPLSRVIEIEVRLPVPLYVFDDDSRYWETWRPVDTVKDIIVKPDGTRGLVVRDVNMGDSCGPYVLDLVYATRRSPIRGKRQFSYSLDILSMRDWEKVYSE
jgi:hypothetical protein